MTVLVFKDVKIEQYAMDHVLGGSKEHLSGYLSKDPTRKACDTHAMITFCVSQYVQGFLGVMSSEVPSLQRLSTQRCFLAGGAGERICRLSAGS